MKNKKIFITGGSGYLGKHLIERYYQLNEIVVYSRDEAKHYFLKKQYPKIKCIIGDIRDRERMLESSIGCNIGIFAASMKQIEACEDNPEEAVATILHGGMNSKYIAQKNNFESACFISSDKSRSATTIYGALKYVTGEIFISSDERYNTNLSVAVYGNVMNSTGSIIPLIWNCINKNIEMTVYGSSMTRFMIEVNDAIDVIEYSLHNNKVNVVPKISSFNILDLVKIYSDQFGLKYKMGSPRINEKIHECMISKDEHCRVFDKGSYYIISRTLTNDKLVDLKNEEFSSKDYVVSSDDLYSFLKMRNFYK